LTLGITSSTRRWARRKWAALGVTVAVAGLLGAAMALANVAPSKFEGGDGNTNVNTLGDTDWDTVAGLHVGTDLPSGSGDNAFGQGTKEDNSAVTVVTGSIPPNKNDLTAFAVASENVSGSQFIYLAWERAVNIGNANLDFEINQRATTGFTSGFTGALTLNRTVGDILISYDFSGSGNPTLGLRTWTGSAWSASTTLTGANSEGAVNKVAINDPKISGNTALGIGLFGEASINLTGAGIFPPNSCEALGTVFVKSRSSSSFTAEIKDFITPVALNVNTCGTIVINKVTVPSPDTTNTNFSFAPAGNIGTTAFSLKNGGSKTYTNVFPGSANSVGETVPTGWTQISATCDHGSPGAITVVASTTTTCTFTNGLLPTITVNKVLDPATDNGKFNLQIDSATAGTGANVGNNGTTGLVQTTIGSHTVGETAGTSTLLTNYSSSTSCADNGGTATAYTTAGLTVAYGDNWVCTITNHRKPTITVNKVVVPSTAAGLFNLQIDGLIAGTGGNVGNGGTTGKVQTTTGSHTVGETAGTSTLLTDYSSSTSCADNGGAATAYTTAGLTVAYGDNWVCTITNTLQYGALQITKVSLKDATVTLAGAQFTITGPSGTFTGLTTDANGVVCKDGLLAGDYSVTETLAPPSYAIDTTTGVTKTVTASNAKCTDSPFVGQTLTFTDTPLTDLKVTVSSQDAGLGGSNSTISCKLGTTDISGSPQGPLNSATVDSKGLLPGTYVCTVVIDP
jgi:hypothetical protein